MVASYEKVRGMDRYRPLVIYENGSRRKPLKAKFLLKDNARHYAQLWINANNEPALRAVSKK